MSRDKRAYQGEIEQMSKKGTTKPNKTLEKLNRLAHMLDGDGITYEVRKHKGAFLLAYEFETEEDERRPGKPATGASRGLVDAWEAYQIGEEIGGSVAEAEDALLVEVAEELKRLRGMVV